jgi:multiple sugar transport system substrate-binding protein
MTIQMAGGLCAAGLLLVACASIGERIVVRTPTKNRVTVIYWEKWTGNEEKEMRKVVDDFNASQAKIFVKYLSVSGVDTKTLLATAGDDPPDVAGIWQEDVCPWADAKALTDLTDMATQAGLTASYYIPGYWKPLFVDNRLWALPSTPASIALHVRPDLVPKDVATPETFPKTIEDFDKLVFRISTRRPDGSLAMAGFLPSNPGWWNWAWSGLFGGKLIDGDRITIDTPQARTAFRWIDTYGKKFGASAVQSFQSGFGNFESPQDPFMIGKVATELNGVWKGNYIKVEKPGTPWFAVPMPYPANRPDLADHCFLSQDVLAIPRGAKHVKEAFEFIRYVQRQDVMEGLCIGHGKNSPLAKVSEHFFQVHPNKFIRLFDRLARSKNALSIPVIGVFPQMSDDISTAFQEVTTEQKTPDRALADAQKRAEGQWKTYRTQILGESQ